MTVKWDGRTQGIKTKLSAAFTCHKARENWIAWVETSVVANFAWSL